MAFLYVHSSGLLVWPGEGCAERAERGGGDDLDVAAGRDWVSVTRSSQTWNEVSSDSRAAASAVVQVGVEPSFLAQPLDDGLGSAHPVAGPVAPCGCRGRVGIAGAVQGPGDGRDPGDCARSACGAQARICPAASPAACTAAMPAVELLPVIEVHDQCLEQLGVVGVVKIKRRPRDAWPVLGDRRHGGDGIALLLQELAGGVQDPVLRA